MCEISHLSVDVSQHINQLTMGVLLKDKVQTAEILPPLPPESRSREGETTILL